MMLNRMFHTLQYPLSSSVPVPAVQTISHLHTVYLLFTLCFHQLHLTMSDKVIIPFFHHLNACELVLSEESKAQREAKIQRLTKMVLMGTFQITLPKALPAKGLDWTHRDLSQKLSLTLDGQMFILHIEQIGLMFILRVVPPTLAPRKDYFVQFFGK